jgi:hypothetical protein
MESFRIHIEFFNSDIIIYHTIIFYIEIFIIIYYTYILQWKLKGGRYYFL